MAAATKKSGSKSAVLKIADPPPVSERKLKKLIEDATVDCYDDSEVLSGFLSVIQDNLTVPFETIVLGHRVTVIEVDFNDSDDIVAICESDDGDEQAIPILNLPLPKPPPTGYEWIEAYRRFTCGNW